MPGELEALNEVSLPDRAREMIRGAILEGVLKPDERFTIEDIAARLGVSRTPVREALKALERDGMVRLLPHRGAMVERYAYVEIRNRFVITAMLEGYAAELASQVQPQILADKLEANCDELERLCKKVNSSSLDDVRKLTELNREFHALIREASGSPTLLRLLGSLRQPTSYTLNYWKDPAARATSLAVHRKIVAAFRKGDAVGALVKEHLMEASERIMRRLVENEETGQPSREATEIRSTRPQRKSPASARNSRSGSAKQSPKRRV